METKKVSAEVDLSGNLSLTHLVNLIQFLHSSGKSGEMILHQTQGTRGRIFFSRGEMVHVACGNVVGMDALVEILGWDDGTFRFVPESLTPQSSIQLPTQHAIMEAIRLRDEREKQQKDARSDDMLETVRESEDVLEDLLRVPGVDAVVIIGRDGFVIESVGSSQRVDLDALGASLAHAINGIEEMGGELEVDRFQDIFIEYGRAVILCRPVGDAIATLVAPDSSKLGIIRHKCKGFMEELVRYF